MATALWTIAAYAAQLAALAVVAIAAAWLLRVRTPRHLLRFWQAVLGIAMLTPLVQPRSAAPTSINFLIERTASAAIAPAAAPIDTTSLDIPTIVLGIIALGIVARLAWLALGLIRLRAIVAGATPDLTFAALNDELSSALGITADVRVSDHLTGPATVGARRPMVLLPPSVRAMSTSAQRAILCHELIHVKRGDWLQTIGEELWCAVLWFHPLARVIASRISLAREMVVDEATILATQDRRAYAEALLAFSNPQARMFGVTPFIGRRTLSQRMSLIVKEVPMSNRRALLSAGTALIASLAITAVAVDRFPMFVTAHAQSTVHKPGDGVSLPQVVHEVKPEYTREAMQQLIQGTVWLLVVVDERGDVSEVTVSKSLDKEYGLDQAAIDAAKQWRFKPGEKDGKAVAVQVTIELTFTLK
jgi:TonB family protein